MSETLREWLTNQGLANEFVDPAAWFMLALGVLIIAWVSNWLARNILVATVSRLVQKSRTLWDDALLKRKVFSRLAHIAPALVIYFGAKLFGPVEELVLRLSLVYMITVGLLVVNAFLNAVVDIYQTLEIARRRPIKGYVQIAQIVMAVVLTIVAVATLMDRSPWLLLSGLGAMTAVLLLVFKDSILGLVASIQLTSNDMIRIGDWIEMPNYGADGDVIDISLHTVKVQNWDKTISTIPAYALISDAFKNWRGMDESDGRRIKRSIRIDMNTIKFCNQAMLDRFGRFQLLTDYVKSKQGEIVEFNQKNDIDGSETINGRNMTNIGTFRAYVVAYLRNHPKINKDMTFLIRQLPPDPNGLPIEIYVFSNVQEWVPYEGIISDIFDHMLAALPWFELRPYQNPSGYDFRQTNLSDRAPERT